MSFPVNSQKPILASSHLLDTPVGRSVLPQAWVVHSFSLLCAGPGAGPQVVPGLPGILAHQASPLWPPTPEKPAGGFSFTPWLFRLLLPSLQAWNQAVFSPQGRASHFSIFNSLGGCKILWFCRPSGYVPLLGWVWLSPMIFYTNQKGQPSPSTSNIYIFFIKKITFSLFSSQWQQLHRNTGSTVRRGSFRTPFQRAAPCPLNTVSHLDVSCLLEVSILSHPGIGTLIL